MDYLYFHVRFFAAQTPFVRRYRSYEKEKKEKNLFPGKPFIPSSPTKVPTGAGTIYGTFQNFPYMKTTDEYDKHATRPHVEVKRNFLTSPSKRGRYGSVGVNIGGRPEGVTGEFSYSPPNPQPFPFPPRPKSESNPLRPFTPASPPKRVRAGPLPPRRPPPRELPRTLPGRARADLGALDTAAPRLPVMQNRHSSAPCISSRALPGGRTRPGGIRPELSRGRR